MEEGGYEQIRVVSWSPEQIALESRQAGGGSREGAEDNLGQKELIRREASLKNWNWHVLETTKNLTWETQRARR